MGLDEDFQTAQDLVSNKINKTLSNDELLEIYALFKQASVGDCNTSRPGMMDFKASQTYVFVLKANGKCSGKSQVGRLERQEGYESG